MSDRPSSRNSDISGTIGALILIVVGGVSWWSTTKLPNVDAYIFPRVVIAIMVFLSLCLILRNWQGFGMAGERSHPSSVMRRIALVFIMVLAAYFMSVLGFILTTFLTYMDFMVVAMYERWTRMRMVVYPLAGLVL